MSNRRELHIPARVIGEGAILELLRRREDACLDAGIANAGLIYTPEGAAALRAILEEYAAIASAARLPFLFTTPTWRAQPPRVARSPWHDRAVNADAARFIRQFAAGAGVDHQVAGLIGPQGDCYRPEQAPDAAAARGFHREQVMELAGAGVDWILAATLPALSEAEGILGLAEEAGIPIVPSFVLGPDGRLLDGHSLGEAVDALGSPLMLNCTHWSFARRALSELDTVGVDRILGLQANTAACHPRELDGSSVLVSEPPEAFAAGMRELAREFRLRILGGCCGTTPSHMKALAAAITGP